MKGLNHQESFLAMNEMFGDGGACLPLKQMAINLVRLCEERKRQILLLTSSTVPPERSPVAPVLAFTLAHQGKRTAVITESQDLGHWNLEQNQDYNAMMRSDQEVGPAPARLANPFLIGISDSSDVEIYHTGRTAAFLTWARSRFDFVAAWLPGFHSHPLPLFLAAHVDGIILVIDDHTTKRSALFMKKKVEEAGGEILGVIMDRMADPIPPVIMRRWNLG